MKEAGDRRRAVIEPRASGRDAAASASVLSPRIIGDSPIPLREWTAGWKRARGGKERRDGTRMNEEKSKFNGQDTKGAQLRL